MNTSIADQLQQVTREIQGRMQKEGWYYGPSRDPRHDCPTPWHINCGWCEEWAWLAQERVGGEVWGLPSEDHAHVVLLLDGRYYDSQHPEGVDDWHQLDLVCGVPLEQFLSRTQKNPARWEKEIRWYLGHKAVGIAGPVRVYTADVPGKGPYKLILRRAVGGSKPLTRVELRDANNRQIGRVVLDSLLEEKGANRKVVRAAKKWAYYKVLDPLELLAREAPDW